MKKLKIIQISPPQELVPPVKYGGIELVVSHITEELVRRGHEVYLLAAAGSKTAANLVPVYKKTIIQSSRAEDHSELEVLKSIGIANAVKAIRKINPDIIHHHWSGRIYPFLDELAPRTLTTIHYNMCDANMRAWYGHFRGYNYVSISNNQRKGMPDINYLGTVCHGINAGNYEYNADKGNYFAFLGRIWPDKGPKEAILAAKAVGVKLKIAARIDFGKAEEYFKKEIEPLIDGKQIEFIGEVGSAEKSEFLRNAVGLVSPIQWEEPFGLIFIEAMACGTPIISFRRGAVPEIVLQGKTGFMSNPGDTAGLAASMKLLADMSKGEYTKMRQACRARIESHFTTEKMVDEYEAVYKKILASQKL